LLRSIANSRQSIADSPRYRWWVFWAIAAGSFLSVVDHGSVMVALPEIESYFGADLPTVQWVVIGYALAISVLLLPMGRLGDMAGRRRIYILGFCIFVLAAALAGSSRWTGLPTLITAKAIQGIGSAMIQGNGMATIIGVFPGNQRGKALGYHLTVVGAGAIAGPALGGLLISLWGWQSVFFINVPVGIMTIAISALVLRDQIAPAAGGPGQGQTFDWQGALLSGATLLTALLTVGNGAQVGWTTMPILAGACVAFVRCVHLVGTADPLSHAGPAVVPPEALCPGRGGGLDIILGQLSLTVFDAFLPAESIGVQPWIRGNVDDPSGFRSGYSGAIQRRSFRQVRLAGPHRRRYGAVYHSLVHHGGFVGLRCSGGMGHLDDGFSGSRHGLVQFPEQ